MVLGLLAIIPFHLLSRLFTRRSPFAPLFLRWVGWCAGARVRIEGTPVRHKVLYVANHVSWLDIMVLAGATGCAFIAKDEMEGWPVLGWLAQQNNTVFVARDSRQSVHRQRDDVRQALLSPQPLCLFPEGTTTSGRSLLPFRSSLISAVTPAPDEVQIQPVALDYGALTDAVAWVSDDPVGHVAFNVMWHHPRIPVRIAFLEPLDHSDFADRKAIAAHSRAEIAEALGGVAD
jgi:1-acyl-sn-glycerol-3-phosphate acyltransferase